MRLNKKVDALNCITSDFRLFQSQAFTSIDIPAPADGLHDPIGLFYVCLLIPRNVTVFFPCVLPAAP